jgi:hypothetical protein
MKIACEIILDNQTFYPFDEVDSIITFNKQCLLKRGNYSTLCTSSYGSLGEYILSVAEDCGCVAEESEGYIFINNPNNLYTGMTYTLLDKIVLHFAGIVKPNDSKEFVLCTNIIQ